MICRPAALRGESGDHQQVAGTMLAAMEYVLEYVLVENEDVLGLVVGSWAHFPFFSVANTRTWHKSSAVTHHFPAPSSSYPESNVRHLTVTNSISECLRCLL